MKTLEIVGPVGAGKSSIVRPMQQALARRGFAATAISDIATHRRPARAFWSMSFALGHPRLTWVASRGVLASPIPLWHKRLIIGLTIGVGGRILAASRSTPGFEWLIVDEGLVHRAVNIYGWRTDFPRHQIESYLENVPVLGPLVVLDVAPEAAIERATRRGFPKRLAGRSEADVAAFVRRSVEITRLAANTMRDRGARVVCVDNSRSLGEAAERAAEQIASGLD